MSKFKFFSTKKLLEIERNYIRSGNRAIVTDTGNDYDDYGDEAINEIRSILANRSQGSQSASKIDYSDFFNCTVKYIAESLTDDLIAPNSSSIHNQYSYTDLNYCLAHMQSSSYFLEILTDEVKALYLTVLSGDIKSYQSRLSFIKNSFSIFLSILLTKRTHNLKFVEKADKATLTFLLTEEKIL